tara:strand:+ start:427 stop:708 length:282 start_codon:yes stop_codon:yes gene_type:complete
MRNISYYTIFKIKIEHVINSCIDFIYNKKIKNRENNDNIINLDKKEDKDLIRINAEKERKNLAKKLGISERSSWKKIVRENDKLFTRPKYDML